MDDAVEEPQQLEVVTEETSSDYQTLAHGVLSPRHRRLAQLAASGKSNAEIAKELDYSDSRVSILLKNPYISAEVRRLQDKIFEETIKERLKGLNEHALNHMHTVLTDRSNRVKISEKNDIAKWVLEKTDGKAAQTLDIGQNLLGVLLDRLDAQRSATPSRDVSEVRSLEAAQTPETQDELANWVDDFSRQE